MIRSSRSLVEEALSDGGYEAAIAPSGEEAVTLLQGTADLTGHSCPTSTCGVQRLGSRKTGQRDRSGLPDHLHDRRGDRSMGLARRAQQHYSNQAVCASATCHCSFPASRYWLSWIWQWLNLIFLVRQRTDREARRRLLFFAPPQFHGLRRWRIDSPVPIHPHLGDI
jgi:CheY-like chemotaxis protein